MIKLRYSKRLFKRSCSSSKATACVGGGGGGGHGNAVAGGGGGAGEIEWEVRPGGMLVQKREGRGGEEVILVRVSTGFAWHDVSIAATSTFGELKVRLSMVTGLEPREQRLLFRGKEREDTDHLHMVGVRDKDKVLLLEDPALKDMKVRAALAAARVMQSPCQPFIQV
uniref:Ubiquitin-like domain-containing protein n=1 Tax=Oryza meridionalis TaxID=40149 RepID=A0A0E0CMV6_9ORYZ